jgi:hypothetical protein
VRVAHMARMPSDQNDIETWLHWITVEDGVGIARGRVFVPFNLVRQIEGRRVELRSAGARLRMKATKARPQSVRSIKLFHSFKGSPSHSYLSRARRR